MVRRAIDEGIDVVDLLSTALNLDPSQRYRAHLELARKFLEEGKALVYKDPVQASEKLYKAAEEAVKALAIRLGLDEAERAAKAGRWTAELLFHAVDSISARLGVKEFRLWWRVAWFLHVEGFHEAKLDPGQVSLDVEYIEDIVGLAERTLGG